MKRFLAAALIVGVSTFGLVGCEDKGEVKKVEEIKTPEGTNKTTDTHKVETTGGDKAPANSAGETPKTVEPPK